MKHFVAFGIAAAIALAVNVVLRGSGGHDLSYLLAAIVGRAGLAVAGPYVALRSHLLWAVNCAVYFCILEIGLLAWGKPRTNAGA